MMNTGRKLFNNFLLRSAQRWVDHRIKRKRNKGELINVLFIVHRASLMTGLWSIIENLRKKNYYSITILRIPVISVYNESAIIFESGYDKICGDYVVDGYDSNKEQFIDITRFKPDFVFYQQPYNGVLPPQYRSGRIKRIAKICYCSYFTFFEGINNENALRGYYPYDFFKDVSFFFAQNLAERNVFETMIGKDCPSLSLIVTGNPKFDNFEKFREFENQRAEKNGNKTLRVLWAPSWQIDKKTNSFVKYKDFFIELCKKEKTIELVFRPHPYMWRWMEDQKLIGYKEEFIREIAELNNFSIHEMPEYRDQFFMSDCLVADKSSIVLHYFLTGKPIIYMYEEESDYNFSKDGKYSKYFYYAKTMNEVTGYLDMIKKGNDVLREERIQEIERQAFTYDAGKRIVDGIST